MNKIICKHCGKELEPKKGRTKFCDHSCAASFNNKNKVVKKKGNCIVCGKELKKLKSKYCSASCQNRLEWDIYVKSVEKERKFPIESANPGGRVRRAKRYLVTKFGYKCSICNTTEWTGKPVPLVLDHINGNPMDWSLENCRLVCRNCDGLLPTFCSKNKNAKGSDRYLWRKRKAV